MNEKWVEIRKGGNFKELGEKLGVSPVIARIMRNRGLETVEEMESYLNPSLQDLHDPSSFKGMKILISVMAKKIREGKKIRIIGDYDVDGISSTYILYRGLSYLGGIVDYTIPHRIEDGYGINIRLIDEAHAAGIDTIITCDNGIAARNQTEHANDLSMTMVITDHHEVPFEMVDGEKRFLLPNADAIVDPKQPGETYPFSGICGAVVAYKVIQSLTKEFGRDGEEEYLDMMEELLELAALATNCDVMELKDENRAILKYGLRNMEHSRNLGIRTLIHVMGIEGRKITPYHCGFVIGPCFNASGRLDTALRAMDLLTCKDPELALKMAEEMKALNDGRKQMTIDQTEVAIRMVEEGGEPDKVIVLLLPDCHESIAGIIAGKVRERFSHPAFVLTRTEKGLKGSGRSIDAYNMYEGLTAVSETLTKFGGHKLAAGISLEEESLEAFKRKINENCTLGPEDFKETVRIDMEMPFSYANLDLARELEKLEPCGTGNERPLFAKTNVTILSGRKFGKAGNVGKYRVSDGAGVYELTYFGDFDAFEDYVASIYDREKASLLHSGLNVDVKLNIVYQLSVNEYLGRESAQMVMKYYM